MTTVPSNLVPIRVTDLPVAPIPEPTGTIPIVIGGILYQVRFIDVQSTVSVPSTRTINTGGGLTGGGDLSQDRTISLLDEGVDDVKLTDSGVTAGVYGGTNSIPVITVNSKGRVTDVTLANIDFTGYVPDTRQIFAGTGLTGGGALTANRTLSIDFSTATPLSLGSATAGTGVKAAREDHVHPAVDLTDATEATGILPLTNGGTGMQVNNLVAGAIWYTDGSNGFLQTTQGNLGQVLVSGASGAPSWGSALIMSDQPANYVYAGPASGPAAPTAFRALVNADIPSTLTGKTMSGSLNTFSNIPNTALTNSSVTFNGVTVALGASGTITATATNALTVNTGLQLNSGTTYDGSAAKTISIDNTVVTLTGSQTLTNKTISGSDNTLSNIPNSSLTNSSVTINGSSVSLGGSVTVTATATNALTIGTGLSGTSYNGSAPVTVAISNTGVSANTYGSASAVPVFAVNAQGQLTSVTNTSISIASSAITDKGLANGVASLDAGGTVPLNQIPASIQGGLIYQGTWNAATNTPTLTSGVGTKGHYYVVSVAGATNLDGITDWNPGDIAVFNGTVWEQIDNTDAVTSVNGYTGAVVLTYTDVGAQQADAQLTDIAGLTPADGAFIVGNGTNFITESGSTARTSLGAAASGANSDITSMSGLTGGIATPEYIDFDTTNTVARATGRLWWDNTNGIQTLNLGMAGSNATLQIGQESYYRIKASAAITEGQVVMFTGTIGGSGALTGAPATGLTAETASYIMGVATEDIANNGWGYVTNFGLVRGINTTGGAEAWVDGQILYYNPSVAGGLTKTVPAAPNAKIQVCAVVNAASGGSGSIFVRPTFGGRLGQYEGDVEITSPANGDLLIYNSSQSRWENSNTVSGGTY